MYYGNCAFTDSLVNMGMAIHVQAREGKEQIARPDFSGVIGQAIDGYTDVALDRKRIDGMQ
jgi:hypothetical protein